MIHRFFYLTLSISLVLLTACEEKNHISKDLVYSGFTMGTSYTVKISDADINELKDKLRKEIESILDDINQQMSTYITDSELSLLNKSHSNDWIKLSLALFQIIERAIQVSQLSSGAFDITSGPIVNLWGFGPAKSLSVIPSKDEIQRTLAKVGYQQLKLDKTTHSIKKLIPEIYIDLSGIAKGYGVDRVAAYLQEMSLQHFMVEIGGEIKAQGKNDEGTGWRIGIEKPLADQRRIQQIITLDNIGMATSGDYHNYFELKGKRYSHTFDPKTGMPVSHNLASITVLHNSTTFADAMATALLVMGPEQAYALATKINLAAYLIIHKGDTFEQRYTNAFTPYLVKQ